MEEMNVKCYRKDNNFIVLDSQGMNAFMHLTQLLWNDKTNVDKTKIDYNIQKHTIIATTKEFKYIFENVPMQWDGRIDTSTIYTQHIQKLKESKVI